MKDYLKIGKATELEGGDKRLYRFFEILPGFLSWGTLLGLIILSYLKPVWVAYFIILFDIYWLLLVLYLGVHLIVSFSRMQKHRKMDWLSKCKDLEAGNIDDLPSNSLARKGVSYKDVRHLIIIPFVLEGYDILKATFQAIIDDPFDEKQMIVVLASEGRAGNKAQETAKRIEQEFAGYFDRFLITVHPDGIEGEIKGKGANQAWAAKEVKEKIIEKEGYNEDDLLVSVFDSDTVVYSGYFACLTYLFLTVPDPYRASYQPIPLYHNNIWEVPFFSRVAASSNTFWQMMQQIRVEKLATYSSHSMTWKALLDVGFWSTSMVSEDSRIFWHCFCYYNGNYRVVPMYFPISMDSIEVENTWTTLKGLYKQQRRWGWGVENLPYLFFNAIKRWKNIPKAKFLGRIWVQIHGFHSWATNALIIALIGWMPLILGGDNFKATVLSGNLPVVTRTLMTLAMSGLLLSAIMSTLLMPPKPKKFGFFKRVLILLEWLLLPLSIVIFGTFPAIDSQTRLMLGKYMGFLVTPKGKSGEYETKEINAAD
ncbi:hypothetical protein GF382_02595 [Candidatus Falkowbacteria bacterium]|nr:hypothetical protein [Candidatus Falkowbacteria bacterium]